MKTPSAKKKPRILIIDDNRSIHGDFSKILADDRTSDKARAWKRSCLARRSTRARSSASSWIRPTRVRMASKWSARPG